MTPNSFEARLARVWPWLVGPALLSAVALRTLLPIALLVLVPLAARGWRVRHGQQLRLYREIAPRVLGEALLAVLAITLVGVLVFSLEIPLLNWGWFSLVAEATTPPDQPTAGATNIVVVPLEIPWLALPFLALLFFVLPDLAAAEERIFRLGTRDWRDGVRRSLLFGLAHLVMGIPIGAVLPLALAGLWMTWHYFRGGIARSTRYHLAYNLILLGLAALLFVVPPLLESA